MKITVKIIASIFFTFIFFSQVKAQHKDTTSSVKYTRDSTTKVIITLKDQSTIKGVIMTMDIEELSLKTEFAGTVVIKQNNIISIVNYNYAETQNQQYPRIYNPNNPSDRDIVKFGGNNNNYNNRIFTPYTNNFRYNFSNNYTGLKKNELTYSNIWVLYNSLDYGINDYFTLGGGVLYLGLGGFINVLARGQFPLNENIKIGASYNYFMLYDSYNSNNDNNLGLLSGGVTLTGKKANITFSIANGYYNQRNSESIPCFSVSGILNINDKTALVSDNIFILSKTNPRSYSLGFRINGRNGNFDFGLMNYLYDENSVSYYGSSSSVNSRTTMFPFLALTQKIN